MSLVNAARAGGLHCARRAGGVSRFCRGRTSKLKPVPRAQEVSTRARRKRPLQDRMAAHAQKRVLGALEPGEVDVGPLLGRGAFGRVYKGALTLGFLGFP